MNLPPSPVVYPFITWFLHHAADPQAESACGWDHRRVTGSADGGKVTDHCRADRRDTVTGCDAA